MEPISPSLQHSDDFERQAPAVPASAKRAKSGTVAPKRSTQLTSRPSVEAIALHRITFGPSPGEIDRVQQMGLAAFIEEQLNPSSLDDSDVEGRIQARGLDLLDADVATLWEQEDHHLNFDQVEEASWLRSMYSRRQLLEVLVDHWHNHFNVYGPMSTVRRVWADYDRRIRQHALGNFRDFLESIATSTSMLYYLDNYLSGGANPNENYARELFELHTLGAEAYQPGINAPNPAIQYPGYRDWDVYESARAFSGWSYDNDTGAFQYNPEDHPVGGKYILNAFIDSNLPPLEDGRIVLDRLAEHPATAKHVVTRLARRLVSDTPSTSLIQAGVNAYMSNLSAADQLKHVVRALLLHPDFTGVWGEKLKRPREIICQALRATQGDWYYSGDFRWSHSRLGQRLFHWGPPNGYPDTRGAWSGATRIMERWTFLNRLVLNWNDESTIDILAQTPAELETPRELTYYWSDRILAYRLTDEELLPIFNFLARGRNLDLPLPAEDRDIRLPSLVSLVLAHPLNQLR